MRYQYAIFYVFSNSRGGGNGWIDISRNLPIRNAHDLQQINDDLLRAVPDADQLTITGWQRFEDPDGFEQEL